MQLLISLTLSSILRMPRPNVVVDLDGKTISCLRKLPSSTGEEGVRREREGGVGKRGRRRRRRWWFYGEIVDRAGWWFSGVGLQRRLL
ncbi:unnamed protein product [Linum trigynum]|uniref:Uncharacterized protein n=1 Tax=Linum trigynum TaxID=586398 RepID=A0AAV2CNE6_9ROSI